MARLGLCAAAYCAALVLAFPALAVARDAAPLTDAQLDNVTAGSFAIGSATATAQGAAVDSATSVITTLGPNIENATASGQAASSASSSSPAPAATASSALSLHISVP